MFRCKLHGRDFTFFLYLLSIKNLLFFLPEIFISSEELKFRAFYFPRDITTQNIRRRGEKKPRRQDETGSPARGKVRGLTVGGLSPVLPCPISPSLSFFVFHRSFLLSSIHNVAVSAMWNRISFDAVVRCISRLVGVVVRALHNGVEETTQNPSRWLYHRNLNNFGRQHIDPFSS